MSLYNVQDDRAPFMQLQGSSGVLPWDSGVLLAYRLRTTALQVSASTLQLYAEETLRFGPSWRSFSCAASTSALCESGKTGVAIMGTAPVTTPRDMDALLGRSELMKAFGGVVCTSERSGRVVGEGDVYTVSMCDLVEGALRFVFVHAQDGGRVYWIRDPTGVGETVLISGIALYAATSLAQNLTTLVAPKPKPAAGGAAAAAAAVAPETPIVETKPKPAAAWLALLNVLVCVACVVVLVIMCETHLDFFVSAQDVDLYRVLLVFLVVDVVLLSAKEMQPRDSGRSRNFGHQIGLSTVMLLLCTLRLHNTFNTPFLHVLLGLFGSRAACKLLQHLHDCLAPGSRFRFAASRANLVSVLVDLGVWCCLLAYGLAQCSAVQEHLALAVNVVTALLLGLGMSVLIAEHKS